MDTNSFFNSSECNPAVDRKILVNGMAKSGTHLVKRVLAMMGFGATSFCLAANQANRAPILWDERNERILGKGVLIGSERPTPIHELLLKQLLRGVSNNQAFNGHNVWTARLERVLCEEKISMICILRDPRDIVVSLSNYLERYQHPDFVGKSADEKLMLAIEGVNPIQPPLISPARVLSISESCCEVYKWTTLPSVLTVKFEELVGPEGGGNLEQQLQTLANIAKFTGMRVNEPEDLRNRLFGRTRTFNVGRIGQWQELFSPQHKARFKEMAGEGLVTLGYESNHAW